MRSNGEALILLEISGSAALMAASHYSVRAGGPVVPVLEGSAGTSGLFGGTSSGIRRNARQPLRARSAAPRIRARYVTYGAVRTRRAQGSTRAAPSTRAPRAGVSYARRKSPTP